MIYEIEKARCKVIHYTRCNIFQKIFFALSHGRNFVPTQNERRLYVLSENYALEEKEGGKE